MLSEIPLSTYAILDFAIPRFGAKVLVLVRVLRFVCFAVFHTIGSGADCIGFHKGLRALQNPIVRLCALELSNPPHRRKSACGKDLAPAAFSCFPLGRLLCSMHWFP